GVDVPPCLVGRDGIQLIPIATGILVEIDAGVGRPVEEFGFQTWRVGQGRQRTVLGSKGDRNQKQNGAHGEQVSTCGRERPATAWGVRGGSSTRYRICPEAWQSERQRRSPRGA